MRCPRCYAYVEEGASSCDTCGANLTNVEPLADSRPASRPRRSAADRPRQRSDARPRPRRQEEQTGSAARYIIITVLLVAAFVAAAIWAFDPFGFRAVDNSATQDQTANVAATNQIKTPAIMKISQADSKEFPKMTVYLAASSAGKPLETLDDKQISISESASGYTYECEIESMKMLTKAEIEKLEFPASVSSALYKIVFKTTYTNKDATRSILVSCNPDSQYTGTASLVYNPSQATKTEEQIKKEAEEKAKQSSESGNSSSDNGSNNGGGQSSDPQPAPAPAPEPAPAPTPSGDSSYVLPDSTSRVYSTSELGGLSLVDLSHARNEIYARHGYIFQRTDVLNYFKGKTWYNPTVPAKDFSWDTLSSTEKQNALNILEVEKSRNSPYL